jgi:glycosyltransferase involved in cell wall biosynthesis
MKILFHHRIRSKDGQFVHMDELIFALREAGHQVAVVGPAIVAENSFGAGPGFVGLLKRYLPLAFYELVEMGYGIFDYLRLARAIRQHRPDALYARYNLYTLSPVWASRRFQMPLILEVNAPLARERSRYGGLALGSLARRFERACWRGADRVVAVTQVLAHEIEAVGVPVERIVIMPNGVRLSRYSSLPADGDAKSLINLNGKVVIGFTGFLREWNGLERLIEWLADAGDPKRHLLLVGDGPARLMLSERARQRGVDDRVTITGVTGREDIMSRTAAMDVAVIPEVTAYASPLKLFEYLAAGRAIVAPATPNLKEILVDGENALLFAPSNPQALQQALDRVCADSDLRARISRGARETIATRGLTWANNADAVVNLFRALLGRSV